METHNLTQGTPEWHAFRANHYNASDAPAMMGVSPYKTRGQLMKERATGVVPEVDAATQRRFDDGHRFEALARTIAEGIIGEELYPVVGSFGNLAASFDGLNMLETIVFEHKMINEEIRKCSAASELPIYYRIQMEQQLLVSGAEKVLFMASKWAGDELVEEKHFFYEPDGSLQEQIIAGWAQFEKDMAEFHPKEIKPEATGSAPEALPALRIELSGGVTASNLAEFKEHALTIFKGIKTELASDEDFADADKTTKWCKEVEDRLEAAKQHALSQTASIDELFRTIDAIKEEARQKRLTLEKLVKNRKDAIRIEKVEEAKWLFLGHVAELQAEIVGIRFVMDLPDFGGAIKGLKSIASIDNALDTLLAQSKIEADAKAKDIRAKLSWCKENATGYSALFPDLQQLSAKPMEDFTLTISSRIEQHKKAEADKLEAQRQKMAEEFDRVHKEELARIEAEERERIRKEELAKIEAEKPVTVAPAEQAIAQPIPVLTARPVPPAVIELQAAKPQTPPTLTLGAISERLGFTVSGAFLQSLGFEPVKVKAANLYHEADFEKICRAIVLHVLEVCEVEHA